MLRVSQMSFYRQTISSLGTLTSGQYTLSNQIESGLRIGKPSDDPIGSITAQLSHQNLEQVGQYDVDVDHAKGWLEQAESSISSMLDLVMRAQERAEQGATGTYDGSQRNIIAQEMEGIMSQLLSLGNTEISGAHIFGGTAQDDPAVTETLTVQSPAVPNSANTGTGGIYAGGTYRGDLSRTYSITVDAGYAGGIPSAANPMDVNVSYMDDWGRTVTRTVTLTGTGNGFSEEIGDGITIYAQELDYQAGDDFDLTVGRQQGNDEDIQVNLSWDNRMTYNYNLNDIFGSEGNKSGDWTNLLDQMAEWINYMEWDEKDRDSYDAIPATYNNPTSTGSISVSGIEDYTAAAQLDLEFNVGGPIQSQADDADLVNYRNFTVDAAYTGGTPAAGNPMTLNYEFWNGAAWVPQSVAVSGTGYDNQVTLAGGVDIYVANNGYSASDGPYELTPVYPEGTEPSAANPMTMTYTYNDPTTGTRMMGTATFTGTGDANSVTLDPPDSAITLTLSEDGTFDDFDYFEVSLEQYGQGQARSQEMIVELESSINNLLKYVSDAGSKLSRLEVRISLLGDEVLRSTDRLEATEDTDMAQAMLDFSTLETMYQAALSATATVTSRSLADYL